MECDLEIRSFEKGMEGAVTEYAVKLHSIFRKIISKHGEECVRELFPFCIEILENFNYHIVNNDKLANAYDELLKKYDDTSEELQKLKILRQKDLEKSLGIEDDLEQELLETHEKIHSLEKKMKASLEDLNRKSETINYLNDTINCLGVQIENLLNDKISLQNEMTMMQSQYYFPIQYPAISVPIAVQTLSLNVFQGVPNQPCQPQYINDPKPQIEYRQKKRKINCNINFSLYSDDRGKDLSSLLKKQFSGKNVYIKPSLVKSGAPLEEILRVMWMDEESFGENDVVVIIGGSNDIGFTQLEGMIHSYDNLFKQKLTCKLIISTIPPRYDLSPYCNENNVIREVNAQIKHLAKSYDVKVLDLGSKNRRFFTTDGKHFNTAGKTSLVKDMYKIIAKW